MPEIRRQIVLQGEETPYEHIITGKAAKVSLEQKASADLIFLSTVVIQKVITDSPTLKHSFPDTLLRSPIPICWGELRGWPVA